VRALLKLVVYYSSSLLGYAWCLHKQNYYIVMLDDSNAVRGNWTIGRIIEVHPGKDGKVRNVTVKTQNDNYRRPITKISVIHPVDGE
jgi:hypothetical protein